MNANFKISKALKNIFPEAKYIGIIARTTKGKLIIYSAVIDIGDYVVLSSEENGVELVVITATDTASLQFKMEEMRLEMTSGIKTTKC